MNWAIVAFLTFAGLLHGQGNTASISGAVRSLLGARCRAQT